MLKHTLDLEKPHIALAYLRMSSDLQNSRSPDQQLHEIKSLMERLKRPWTIAGVYRDDAKTGRRTANRPQYNRMLQDITCGASKASLLLVDTLERFGRTGDVAGIRKRLYEKHGVAILTADSHFADPTTMQGRALGFVESLRSTEHGAVLAHNVVRGKRDAARQKHWPGGAPPIGYLLQSVLRFDGRSQVVDYSVLAPDPVLGPYITLLFEKAAETGWGGVRLATFIGGLPGVPEAIRSMSPTGIMYALKNEIYRGELAWSRNSTGIVDDVRVVRRNPDEEVTRIRDFCVPLVSDELWTAVNSILSSRSRRQPTDSASPLEPVRLAQGTTLCYPLSGLLVCSVCGLRMRATSTGAYMNVAGDLKRYAKYKCLGSTSSRCTNKVKVPEEWIRHQVIRVVTDCLLGGTSREYDDTIKRLLDNVQEELTLRHSQAQPLAVTIQQERDELTRRRQGWMQSLSKPDLAPGIRSQIECAWGETENRLQQLSQMEQQSHFEAVATAHAIQPDELTRRLGELDRVLTEHNPTLSNMALSWVIDSIECHPCGEVVLKLCKLGLMPSVLALLTDAEECQPISSSNVNSLDTSIPQGKAELRRRSRLAVSGDINGDWTEHRASLDFVADPHRFRGLDEKWFSYHKFQIPTKEYWIDANHEEVKRLFEERAQGGNKPTLAELARHFGTSEPSIANALKFHALPGGRAAVDRRHKGGYTPKLTVEINAEIVRRYESGQPENSIYKELNISRGSVSKALDQWDAARGVKRPDGRQRRWELLRALES